MIERPPRLRSRAIRLLSAAVALGLALAGCSATAARPPSTAAPTQSDEWYVVGLGDSIPDGGRDCAGDCRTYPVLVGDQLATVTGRSVHVDNDASNEGVVSSQTLESVTSDKAVRAAIREADVVVLTTGNNDLNDCSYWGTLKSCTDALMPDIEDNIGKILTAVTKLRDGKPTAIRVTNLYNTWVDIPTAADDWSVPAADVSKFEPLYGAELRALGDGICKVATAHGAVCVDILTAFNGPAGDQPAGPLLMGDGIHPSAAGHQKIAELIAAAGFAELK
ncbi:hypothetical protein BH10ACT6_BH10ACT6_02350 [soil metagenome]